MFFGPCVFSQLDNGPLLVRNGHDSSGIGRRSHRQTETADALAAELRVLPHADAQPSLARAERICGDEHDLTRQPFFLARRIHRPELAELFVDDFSVVRDDLLKADFLETGRRGSRCGFHLERAQKEIAVGVAAGSAPRQAAVRQCFQTNASDAAQTARGFDHVCFMAGVGSRDENRAALLEGQLRAASGLHACRSQYLPTFPRGVDGPLPLGLLAGEFRRGLSEFLLQLFDLLLKILPSRLLLLSRHFEFRFKKPFRRISVIVEASLGRIVKES